MVNQLEGATFNDVGLNGLILISTMLDFGAGSDANGNELSFFTNLPSMAVTRRSTARSMARVAE